MKDKERRKETGKERNLTEFCLIHLIKGLNFVIFSVKTSFRHIFSKKDTNIYFRSNCYYYLNVLLKTHLRLKITLVDLCYSVLLFNTLKKCLIQSGIRLLTRHVIYETSFKSYIYNLDIICIPPSAICVQNINKCLMLVRINVDRAARNFQFATRKERREGRRKLNVFLKIYVLIFSLYRALTSVRGKKREKSDREIQSCILCHNNAQRKHVTKAFPFVRELVYRFALSYRQFIKL